MGSELMRPEDVKVGDVYRRPEFRIRLANESDRQFTVLAIEVDPECPDLGPQAVTCKPGAVDKGDGFVHSGVGCCGWFASTIATDVNSGALAKVTT